MKKMISFVFLFTILATGMISVNADYCYPPEGGHWKWGVGLTGTYSDYRHDQKRHTATVISGNTTNRDTANPTYWAKARLVTFGGASCYYGLL